MFWSAPRPRGNTDSLAVRRIGEWFGLEESQNGWGGQGSLEITQSSPLPWQGHLEQVTQECIQEGLGFLHTGRLQALPGQFQRSATLHGKRFFLTLRGIPHGLVYGHCSLSCCWALLERVWHCLLGTKDLKIYPIPPPAMGRNTLPLSQVVQAPSNLALDTSPLRPAKFSASFAFSFFY